MSNQIANQKGNLPFAADAALNGILIYMGGIFICVGFYTYIAMEWLNLASITQVAATLGVGIIAYGMAMLLLSHNKFDKLGVIFYILSCLTLSAGILVTYQVFYSIDMSNHEQVLFILFGIMSLLQGIMFYIKRLELVAIALLLSFQGLIDATLDLLGVPENGVIIIVGITILVIMYFFAASVYKYTSPFWNLCGSVWMLMGTALLMEDSGWEVAFFVAPAMIMFIGMLEDSITLLFTSSMATILYMFYLSHTYFVDFIGWPMTLCGFGIVLLSISYVFMHVRETRHKQELTDI